jgi:hypothetical protein
MTTGSIPALGIMTWILYIFLALRAFVAQAMPLPWSAKPAREGGDNPVPLDGPLHHVQLWRMVIPEPAARSARHAGWLPVGNMYVPDYPVTV